jgi:hypothetical protein
MPISQSVVSSGINRPDDVRRVQALLNDWRSQKGRPRIAIDGLVGPEIIGPITDLQQRVSHRVEGRIDPAGPAIKKPEDFQRAAAMPLSLLGLLAVLCDLNPYTLKASPSLPSL